MSWLDLNALAEELEELRNLNDDEDEELDDDDAERLEVLESLDSEINLADTAENEGSAIPDYDFEDYARQLAEDIYDMPEHWPFTCINWEQAAHELQMDYTSFEFEGTNYLVRSY